MHGPLEHATAEHNPLLALAIANACVNRTKDTHDWTMHTQIAPTRTRMHTQSERDIETLAETQRDRRLRQTEQP